MYMLWPHIWNAFIIWKESNYRLKKILWKLGTQIILMCEISETAGHEKQNGFLYWPGTRRRFSRNRCTKHQGEAWTRMFKWRYHPGKRRRFNLRKLYFPSVLLLSLEMLRTIWEIKTLENTKFPASKFRGHWGIYIFSITISSDTFPSLLGTVNCRYTINYWNQSSIVRILTFPLYVTLRTIMLNRSVHYCLTPPLILSVALTIAKTIWERTKLKNPPS